MEAGEGLVVPGWVGILFGIAVVWYLVFAIWCFVSEALAEFAPERRYWRAKRTEKQREEEQAMYASWRAHKRKIESDPNYRRECLRAMFREKDPAFLELMESQWERVDRIRAELGATPAGRAKLAEMKRQWKQLCAATKLREGRVRTDSAAQCPNCWGDYPGYTYWSHACVTGPKDERIAPRMRPVGM